MEVCNSFRERVLDSLGILSLVAALAFWGGVCIVRADGHEAAMSVDPALVAPEAAPAPAPSPPRAADRDRSKVAAVEARSGGVVLNTRGYNYGPPVNEVDPEAMRFEERTPPSPPAVDPGSN